MGPGISSLNPGGQVVTKDFVMQPVAPNGDGALAE